MLPWVWGRERVEYMEPGYPIVPRMELGLGFNLPLSSGSRSEPEEVSTAAGGGEVRWEKPRTQRQGWPWSAPGPGASSGFLRVLRIDPM